MQFVAIGAKCSTSILINTVRHFLYVSLLVISAAAQAQVYQRVDPFTGQVTYTNRPGPGQEPSPEPAVPAPLPVTSTQPDRRPSLQREPAGSQPTTPQNFPRVDIAEQKRRDQDRYRILSDELQAEVEALGKLKGTWESSEAARRHLANIASLKRELSNLK